MHKHFAAYKLHDVQCFPIDGNKQLSTTGIVTWLFVGLLYVRRPPRLVSISSLACTHAYRPKDMPCWALYALLYMPCWALTYALHLS